MCWITALSLSSRCLASLLVRLLLRLRREPGNLLCCELRVHPTLAQVLASHCHRCEQTVSISTFSSDLSPFAGTHSAALVDAHVSRQDLRAPLVRLVLQPDLRRRRDPAQNPYCSRSASPNLLLNLTSIRSRTNPRSEPILGQSAAKSTQWTTAHTFFCLR